MDEVAGELIGAVALVLVAVIGVIGERTRRNARDARNAIGSPNGQGNVTQMLERVLDGLSDVVAGQAGQDRRLANLEGGQHLLKLDQQDTRENVARLAGRVDVLERK